jgi:hypothetical protein
MKKIVRWALAFTAAMSIPSSAMALCGANVHDAFLINGPGAARTVPLGSWRFTLDQLVFGLYDESCGYFVKWVNAAGLLSSANAFVEEVATVGAEDCEYNSYYPQISTLRLSTQPDYFGKSTGFDKFQQKRNVCNLILSEDGFSGKFRGMIQYHPTSVPYGMGVDPRGGCAAP